ncbi:MAG: 50S ribosomal protein L6 [Bacteroidales bacterium]|jgi:large subunit ribosomal protein L6|nr:50S ribosomal protein L6 [Bacteroidales bacterium]
MSRIGKLPISVPAGVEIKIANNNHVTVKGSYKYKVPAADGKTLVDNTAKAELTLTVDPDITVKVEDGTLTVSRPTEQKRHRALHGLYRALLNNMVKGVSEGFNTTLEIVGVGYKASAMESNTNILELALGYSHNLFIEMPEGVFFTTTAEKGKNPTITLTSHNKELLGMVVSKIRSYRKPEPYKGKGIKFAGEVLRRKAGKSASSK